MAYIFNIWTIYCWAEFDYWTVAWKALPYIDGTKNVLHIWRSSVKQAIS